MSLRARLTLLNMVIVGGILLLFGTALYLTFSVVLTNQINHALEAAGESVRRALRVDQRGSLLMDSLPKLDPSTDVYYQVWGRDGQLKYSSPNLALFKEPLDKINLGPGLNTIRDLTVNGALMRVKTIPLAIQGSIRLVGVAQVGMSLSMAEATLRTLLIVLLIGSVLAVVLAGLVGGLSITRALKPINLVTETALQITRADDLSRRIPYQGSPEDEVGQLILAFNQTLSRLENLFDSQRRFLTDVGHELRTPLTVIKGNIDLMRRMNCTDEESMESIEGEVDRLTRLVGDLLLLAQAESGKIPLVRRTVELDTLVLDVMQQMRVLVRNRLNLRLGEIDQVLVCGDQDRLKQVFLNLIGNAIKYTPADGEVVVGVGKVDNRARVTISDTGSGIPVEDMPYIFERFYRGEKSRTRSKDGKGFGLGLSIAYWIVRNHQGQIEVTPNQPQGTTFCVWLPLAEEKCPDEVVNS
jgi:two-component system OmpR family sensor kinase